MKTSNKVLLTAVCSIFVVIMIMGIAVRAHKPYLTKVEVVDLSNAKETVTSENIAIENEGEASATITKSSQKQQQSKEINDKLAVNKKIVVKDFNRLVIHGFWNVKVKQGNHYDVRIAVPSDIADQVKVARNKNTLYLVMEDHFTTRLIQCAAEITMPTLQYIDVSGFSSINFSRFKLDELSLNASGASRIEANHNEIKRLTLESSGATGMEGNKNVIQDLNLNSSGKSAVNLDDSKVKNANIDMSGASHVKLNMRGGNLSGKLNGAALIIYRGKIKEQNITTSGMAKVVKR